MRKKPSDDRTNQKSETFSNINMTHLPMNIMRGDKEGCEKKDGKENVDPVGQDTNDLGSPTIIIDQPQFQIRQPDVDSDAESSSSDDGEDEYITKGPVFPTKQNRQLRENTPYGNSHEYNFRNHYSGGQLIFESDLYFTDDYIQGPNFTREENEQLDDITELLNQLKPDEKERLDAVISNALLTEDVTLNHDNLGLQTPVETLDNLRNETVIGREIEINTTRSSIDEDSAYDTSSPHSSVSNSPMPPGFIHEGSPFFDPQNPQMPLNIQVRPDLHDPRGSNQCLSLYTVSPRQVETIHEKTQPLNIQTCAQINVPSPSLNIPPPSLNIPPSANIQRRPSIAPASIVVVHEEEMKKPASTRIRAMCNKQLLFIQWAVALSDKDYFKENNGLTKLMAHLKSPFDSGYFFEVFDSLMSKLSHAPQNNEVDKCLSYLRYTNQKRESALSIAINDYADRPVVARYILEILFILCNDDVVKARAAEPLLLHRLIKEGDKYAHILAECLNMSLNNNPSKKCFDVNEKDLNGLTPLLLATSLHLSPNKEPNFSTLAITKLLVKHGASVTIGDLFGLTPIDYAVKESCDPQMLKTLLSHTDVIERKAIDLEDHMKNTALHIAAKRYDVPIEVQANVMKQLKDSGWSMSKSNIENKTPQSLLPEDRKKWILDYIQRKK